MGPRRLRFVRPIVSTGGAPNVGLPHKRVFFAGEHTSKKWQGYMNGGVESGFRAAEEVFATAQLSTAPF